MSISLPSNISLPLSPTKLQIFFVAYGLSPVNIFVLTPILYKLDIVVFTSFLAGSKKHVNPTNVIFFSHSELNFESPG